MGKAACCDKNGLKKGPWTAEEDQKLIDYIHKNGHGRWRTLPKNAGLERCGKSCRLRWTNYLRPDIKRGGFLIEEEQAIIQMHSILGNKWSTIASRLPGRTDNEIKNYWNTHIKKKLLKVGIDPVTHKPRLDLLQLYSILGSYLYNSNNSSSLSTLLGIGSMLNPSMLNLVNFLPSQTNNQETPPIPQTQIQQEQLIHQTTQYLGPNYFIGQTLGSNCGYNYEISNQQVVINENNCEKRDSYCSNLLMFDSISNGFGVNGFLQD